MGVPMLYRFDTGSLGKPRLDYDAWRDSLQRICGRYRAERLGHSKALETGCNAGRIERDYCDVRLDGADHYFVLFPLYGQSLMIQNDQTAQLKAGDAVLIDTARPVKFLGQDDRKGPWRILAINLPRQELVAHLGLEPQGGLVRPNGTHAGRLLFDIIQNATREPVSEPTSAYSYMQLVVYDLVGALFASSDKVSGSRHADKLFARVCDTIKEVFVDPDFGPADVAARTGISLRYLQKLFTQRSSTCSNFIYSLRLDHAARLLYRRESLRSGQSLNEIAYACGFRDHTHFARRFRHRFGHSPGAHSAKNGYAGTATEGSDSDERTLETQDSDSPLI